ncbi:polysaccharide deacetylase family protein [Parasphingorhabdus halotolerans]|uniref:WalW protein n=1 Tax=Parasphingorhabdus halotolerans TaxID=2725558 RepID=A0A6H2DIP8_9SPHN|nr:polysaccharide deacetylase family protein [Parasphingorhabdus halotolerans]QJB68204.1 WalW protein [Parasphingorhabdus halotolerans]
MFSKLKRPSGLKHHHFPEDFGRKFLITVDTEEEFDWDGPFERSGHTTVTVPMLERYQEFVRKYGIKPVYFVDYSIIRNDEAVSFLQNVAADGSATIGVHLHPWVNPPFDEETSVYNSFTGNLPKELEEEKITRLRDAIAEKTGVVSTIYRAGRYGVGPNTVAILTKLGFAVDSSVRSRFDYSEEGGPDFQHLGSEPFWLDDNQTLIEIPLTTVFSGILRKQPQFASSLMNKSEMANAIFSRTKMLERIPLTPEGISAREAKEAIDVALDDDLKLLVFSFHSPSLSPGHTPYVQTEEDLNGFYDWWREIIGHLDDRGVGPISMDELIQSSFAK